ncbi:hypothetical protein DPMN_061317 [Dreissena polymorpha]|uniref:Uncharacterized protein n=1 Tax=Dreissena polymorpha TaxID=45954 RepID=A0A9D4C6S7_DREPO|nr:hypothetical protein DPMN_061317 [Dreissena polymorpha]
MAEKLKDIQTRELCEYVLEEGLYDTIGKYVNKGFEKDDQEKKDEKKLTKIHNANEPTGPVIIKDTNIDILQSNLKPKITIDLNKDSDKIDKKKHLTIRVQKINL